MLHPVREKPRAIARRNYVLDQMRENGFISKEMFFSQAIVAGDRSGLRFTLPALATLAGVFSVAYALRFTHQVFFGRPPSDLPRATANG